MADHTQNVIREAHSKSAFRLEIHDDHGQLSSATGFFYEVENALFIVTNWHVVSGKHFLSNEPLSSSGRLPTHLVGDFTVVRDSMPDGRLGARRVPARINLYSPDRSPLWLEHPKLGSRCDVVALPAQGSLASSKVLQNVANRVDEGRVPIEPGCVVFVVGFPRALRIGPGLPLWKSGYIASETTFDITIGDQTLPAFFIDSQTREGMSGSPVFAHYVGIWNPEDPYGPLRDQNLRKSSLGRGMQFLGCYSSRIGPETEGAALGLCWREEILKEICLGNTKGEHPHIFSSEPDES